MAIQIGLLAEEWGWLVGRTGHGQLDAIAGVVSISCTEPAQTIGTTGPWSLSFLPLEGTSEPLPGSPEVFLVFVVEANQEAKDEGGRGLEWAVIG